MAALLGNGEVHSDIHGNKLHFSYQASKEHYLSQFIDTHNLSSIVQLNRKKKECLIHEVDKNLDIFRYSTGNIQKVLTSKYMSKQTLLLLIIVFGKRQLESISIPSTNSTDFIRSLGYLIQQNLGVLTIPSSNSLKILDIPKLLINVLQLDLSLSECVELAGYLNEQEKRQIIHGAKNLVRKTNVYEMV